MSRKNKFGFEPLDATDAPKRTRAPGPMGVAVRETADALTDSAEAKVEARRRNAEDAKAYRKAQDEGRVLVDLPLDDISVDDLPRDRIGLEDVVQSDEMEELKTSIRERGQREPIEVYRDARGQLQLKKGWRRLHALKQLYSESGDARFSRVTARVDSSQRARLAHYIDMVEENVVREDLTFAEMAQVALTAAADPEIEEDDPIELVNRLYAALHKTKRSYIRSFVQLLDRVGPVLKWPKEVSRNLGVEAARHLKEEDLVEMLYQELAECSDPEAQANTIQRFIDTAKSPRPKSTAAKNKQKFEFFVGQTKVTARDGECRLLSRRNFASVPRYQLEDAIRAFEEVLERGHRVR